MDHYAAGIRALPSSLTRRSLLQSLSGGFGSVALANMLAERASGGAPSLSPGAHFEGPAKRVIFLFLNGGPSHVDTFDHKPILQKYHGTPMPVENPKTERKTGNLLGSPFQFRACGQSGLQVSELFSQFGDLIDEACIIRSMHTDRPFHDAGFFLMSTGHNLAGRPSMGSWVTYGLGVENQNLPGYVVLCPGLPTVGPQLWTSSFLPGVFQGTHVVNKNETDPEKLIPNLRNRQLGAESQRRQLDLISKMNHAHNDALGSHPELESAISTMETAFRMQTEAMDAFDIRKETDDTRTRYGDSDFGRGCLLARRLVERGVRMVQVFFGPGQPWDNHDDIMDHKKLCGQADPAIASLIRDLKTSGLLKETLVIIGGEFGRTPAAEVSGLVKVQNGRDHNSLGFSTVLVGGGVKGGIAYGATDDFGYRAVEKPVHVHDLHATALHLLGFDHTRLTYRYSGRDFRLTDVAGT
ncbi:MAG: DUF1501 domain-containing protein, partial [Bryobacteraceae bacterium]